MEEKILKDRIEGEEGCKLKAYPDERGIWTIGYGHNLEAHMSPAVLRQFLAGGGTITRATADALLDQDLSDAGTQVRTLVADFDRLSLGRRQVLDDMCFNLGAHRLAGFHKMLAAVEAGDFETAAAELLDSEAARELPKRYASLALLMKQG